MKRVFLSYAAEDQAVADRIARWLRTRGLEPYWFQDEHVRGRRFVGEIEQAIGEADLFVVLLSPHFLTSAWCRHERDLAFRREVGLRPRQFIRVLRVSAVVTGDAGFLGNYDHLDATPLLTDEKLDRVGIALGLHDEPETTGDAPLGPAIRFRNRENELDAVVNGLTGSGGQDVWLVVAPPKMGKSWFLNQVHRDLLEQDPSWSVRLVDLREHPRELCGDPWLLLGRLLDVRPGGDEHPRESRLKRIAADISGRGTRQLYLLDSADLLEPAAADDLKAALTEIHQRVRTLGNRSTRMGLVISSRRADKWGGLGRDTRYRLRYTPHPLTHFGVDVVHEALAELVDWDLGADRRWAWADDLHRLSEGLPALLVRSLVWAVETSFSYPEDCLSGTVFDEIARPYIREDLLAPDSLLPWRQPGDRAAKQALEKALEILVTYRLLTQSHLRFHLNDDAGLRAAVDEAGWDGPQLWKALGETSLCTRPSGELWLTIEPPIRRLLYRYYNTTPDFRVSAHTVAQRCYLNWTAGPKGGREQPVVLVEYLWHEASRMVIEQPDEIVRLLPEVAVEIANEFSTSPFFEADETREFLARRLDQDDELERLLRRYPGLFGTVTDTVLHTIGGDST